MAETIKIASELESTATGNVVAAASAIKDKVKNKYQSQINQETDAAIQAETERATAQENNRYTKSETYNKTELNNMITTPNQEYVTVNAYASLPVTGSANTIYRVSNYDGSQNQVNPTKYSEYAWNGTQYVFLSVKTQIGEVFDISEYHSGAVYTDLANALGTSGVNVPSSIRRGGMSVKFKQLVSPASYTVEKTEGLDSQPTGTEISTDPHIDSGTYNESQLSAFSTLPESTGAGNAVTYWMEVAGDTTTYTSWVITMVQSSDNKYVQYRLMSDTFNTTPANWQGVDDEPTAGSENLVESGGVNNIKQSKSLGVLEPIDTYSPLPSLSNGKTYILKVILNNDVTHAHIDLSTSGSSSGITQKLVDDVPMSAGTYYYDVTSQGESKIRFYMYLNGSYTHTAVTSYELYEVIKTSISRIDSKLADIQEQTSNNSADILSISGNLSETEETINDIGEATTETETDTEQIAIEIHKEDNTNGYWAWAESGEFTKDATRRSSDKIEVNANEKYLVTTNLRPKSISPVLMYNENNAYIGDWHRLDANLPEILHLEDEQFVVPSGVKYIVINSANYEDPSLKKVVTSIVSKSYTKEESDNKYQLKQPVEGTIQKYGVKWSVSDNDDLGQRCFDAIGLTAAIGVGNTDGHSDFDDIYPWSEMKRCNVKTNANGSKIVTFEGETGFALDGTNGDVFVRIPKFYIEKYKKDGYEYRTVSGAGAIVHPAFIENGKELDEIFVSAFEGYSDGNVLQSKGGVIPSSNLTLSQFLALATAKGTGYTLYDNRTVDAIFTLFAVEFGCRNTNHILGYGAADYYQPIVNAANTLHVLESASNVNTIKVTFISASVLKLLPIGTNLTICQNNDDEDILAQRKILSIVGAQDSSYSEITFDGSPLTVDTDCFVGSAALCTNFCEDCGNAVKLNWHTGRADFISDTEKSNKQNPIRYRWIENILGNLWHMLPDVTFLNQQMYVCDNIADYVAHKYTTPYRAVGDLCIINTNNGTKNDVVGENYWITSLIDDIFAKGIPFGKAYDKSLVSTKAFGAYYYLYDGLVSVTNGGGFDHLYRCNILTQRAWTRTSTKWYLYGARLIYKNIN